MSTLVLATAAVLLLSCVAAAAATDRDALVAFKAGVTSDPTGALRSWNNDTGTHFCRWAGVKCSAAGRVTALDVSASHLAGTLSPAVGDLAHLEVLNLTDNAFFGAIPASLGRLGRLSYLSLCDNVFTGEIPAALHGLGNLTVAYLNKNYLTGGVPAGLGDMPALMLLRLSANSLSGHIPPSPANLTTIQVLQLDENLLEGHIPDGLTRLPNLKWFSVSNNRLSGEIPPGFFNMSSLHGLQLAKNGFQGELPRDAGAGWPNLLYLSLSSNLLTGGHIPATLANATKLLAVDLANNSFTGQVPPEIGKLCLWFLQLSNNELTATDAGGWEFLDNLTRCDDLTVILLDGNKLAGAMPSSVLRLSAQLETLSLVGNRISGVIPPGIGNLVGLQALDLRHNLLAGEIPEGIGKLKNLQELQLQGNELTGPVPSAIGYLTQLLRLDLSDNSLNGSIPPSLGKLQRLMVLNLSGNGFAGHVPRELFSLSSLSSAMDLSGNQLDGVLPPDVGQLVKLTFMALSGNRFTGDMPAELGSCQSLEFLDLDNNLFARSIPPSLCKLKGLRMLNLSSNRLSGAIPPELGEMTGLQELDLSWNDLSGGVPAEFENMSSLVKLDVSGNNLVGNVPQRGVFANATGFKMAGNNALCGGGPQLRLPPCRTLADSTRGSHLFLKIALPIIGAALCIAVLFTVLLWRRKKKSRTTSTAARSVLNGNYYPRVSYAELAKASFAEANLVGAGKYGSVYRGALALKTKGNLAHEAMAVAVKVLDLRQAGACKTFLSECETLRSARHRNLIGIITCCASVDAAGGEFRALVFDFMPNSSLDRWLHPVPADARKRGGLSLVQRLGIAVDIADALSYLHNSCDPPIVHCDLKPGNVLLGDDMTARIGDFGLAKLLLLDAPGGNESTIGIRGTIGYVAPEYGTTGSVSTAGDAYSYGVTLLEILAGKAPTDGGLGDGTTLPEFVAAAFPERIEQVLDPALLPMEELDRSVSVSASISTMSTVSSSYSEESQVRVTARDCVVAAVRVALSCCRRAPYERMGMKEAAAEMHLIRDACLRACGARKPVV